MSRRAPESQSRGASATGGKRADVDARDLDDALAFAEVDGEVHDRHPLPSGEKLSSSA